MSAVYTSQDEFNRRNAATNAAAYQSSLVKNDAAMTDDQRRARALEANARRIAPRYQGTGVASMFGAQGSPAPGSKTLLGQ